MLKGELGFYYIMKLNNKSKYFCLDDINQAGYTFGYNFPAVSMTLQYSNSAEPKQIMYFSDERCPGQRST